jgi:hypothetical protein
MLPVNCAKAEPEASARKARRDTTKNLTLVVMHTPQRRVDMDDFFEKTFTGELL